MHAHERSQRSQPPRLPLRTSAFSCARASSRCRSSLRCSLSAIGSFLFSSLEGKVFLQRLVGNLSRFRFPATFLFRQRGRVQLLVLFVLDVAKIMLLHSLRESPLPWTASWTQGSGGLRLIIIPFKIAPWSRVGWVGPGGSIVTTFFGSFFCEM